MSKVLCVDLDGTLIQTDTLHEAIFSFIKSHPLHVWLLLVWFCRGRAYLKQQLAMRVVLDPSLLPYNQDVLGWMKACKDQGQRLVLVTAADRRVADRVAAYLDMFDEVLASDGQVNLRSKHKAAALNRLYGVKGYDYAGNSRADLAVWRAADASIVVHGSKRLLKRARKLALVSKVFARQRLSWKDFFKAIRVHQYAKNILLFVPCIAGHLIGHTEILVSTVVGFVAFCLMASAVYLLNDLLDLEVDRKHPTKSKRAIAAGLLSIPKAISLFMGFFVLALALASVLPMPFILILGLYFLLTLLYSFWLKQIVLVDVITLSVLYTIRVVAGIALLGNGEYSPWLLLFSGFIFLSLAFLKRISELSLFDKNGQEQLMGRDYHKSDSVTFTMFGIASGFLAVLVFALYLNSAAGLLLYRHTQWLILVFPFLLYWLCRIWLLALQGKVHDDPVLFTIRDKSSYMIGLIIFLLFLWATG